MASSLMDKLKHSFSKPQIQVDRPEEQAVVSEPREIKTAPRKQSDSLSPSNSHLIDAAHSPPSVLTQHLGPPTIEHKYPQDSTYRRHSVSAQEQHYMR